jgi:murein DD-endopeptidase MepM/ murein hydrolase activator NlpD
VTGRVLAAVAAAITTLAFLCVGGLLALTGTASACTTTAITAPTGAGRYDTEQLHHARTIITVGARHDMPVRGQIIAVATALQESGLRNLGHLGARNDHDSLGLFQQRPSLGWGAPAQLTDPAYAAAVFYRRLAAVPGWQGMPLTVAAQAVQRSAYPDAYAKWERDATMLVAVLTERTGAGTPRQSCVSVAGWMKPVPGGIVSGFRTTGRPGHDGVDLAAAKGTPIHAAGSGLVIRVVCNAHLRDGTPYSCDVDGDPVTVLGCGWYVDLLHLDNTVTRYCHMMRRPSVVVGHQIAVGQVIGLAGSSGHSSGPHVHLETHTSPPATASNAVDPIRFFAQRAIDLRSG